MTQLTYRGVPYFKEEEDLRNRNWWNLAHRPNLWLRYRGLLTVRSKLAVCCNSGREPEIPNSRS
jgi:hypothetical protein